MSQIIRRRAVALAWVFSIVAAGALSSALTSAQSRLFGNAQILSGADIGFRVESTKAGQPSGTLMVRIDGQWVEARWAARIMPAK